ncbi:amidohydrolase family protein [Cylindrospermopsis curvispora GIHE-G1]|uniref:Amidohydrolase family protein n=1 Tax=Cylindrospermopsis curvispora GIHE-G1 TaxID=2666332 RepID=A0A7H0F5G7_9CYAN|nr:amidohydrolase family protein [Cylindrospermopsis curvispora GIHE-G1]TPX29870.1 amidohydrolase family protein [Cylindrospermopsis raciborskii GIHE 2018]
MNFTIKNALSPVKEGYTTLDIQVMEGIITQVGQNLNVIGTLIDGQDKLVLPGFFNAHTHSVEKWQRGIIPPLPLELWLAHLCDFAPLDMERVYLSALGTGVETLLSGGTSVVDHLVLIPGQELETIATVVRAYQTLGIRAFIAPLIQDEPLTAGMPEGKLLASHEYYCRSTDETLAIVEQAVINFHKKIAERHGSHLALDRKCQRRIYSP